MRSAAASEMENSELDVIDARRSVRSMPKQKKTVVAKVQCQSANKFHRRHETLSARFPSASASRNELDNCSRGVCRRLHKW